MRKFIFLISFVFLPLACLTAISGWISESSYRVENEPEPGVKGPPDSLAKKFFPLKIGNSWTYKSISSLGDTAYIKTTVLYDTIINNTTFYKLSHEFPYFEGTLLTVDTTNGNLYSFKQNNGCGTYRKGLLLDSLASKLGNKVSSCSGNTFGKCLDTSSVLIFGTMRRSRYFLSPTSADSNIFNRFAEDVGLTHSVKVENSNVMTAQLTGYVLNGSLCGDTITTTHVFGAVVYDDSNLPVLDGYVKAMKLNRLTGEVVILDSVQIQKGGFYYFHILPDDNYYIVAYPNSEEQSDFVATYFPATINWQSATSVRSVNSPENVNITVFKKTNSTGTFLITGKVFSRSNPLISGIKDAIVYLKQGNSFRSYTTTSSIGEYGLGHLSSGNYQVIVNRLGYVNSQQNITINNSNLQNINFFLEPTFIKAVNTTDNLPKQFNLSQNYPNPFNPVTNIKFDIPKSSFVSLKIYNITGKEVVTLVSELKTAGSYVVDFDARNFSSGIYFYMLRTEDFENTKRMVVVK